MLDRCVVVEPLDALPLAMERKVLIPTIEQWIGDLDALVEGPLSGLPFGETDDIKRAFIESFRDEYGSTRATDGALLSRVLRSKYGPRDGHDQLDLDTQLWDAVHSPSMDWGGLISQTGGLVQGDYAIEHRTLIELCALHVLWHLGRDSMRGRIDDLVDWHTRELQPDNGINRPWGVHTFVVRSVEAVHEQQRLDAMLHAQTLVSNCCITLGKPDVLSAVILRDASDALRDYTLKSAAD